MKSIGLLMINGENDILERTLEINGQYVDYFYVLDGTVPHDISESICRAHPKCAGYTRDQDIPGEYGWAPKDGWRQLLYEQAVAEHGFDNWFLLLHGDEVWTANPRNYTYSGADGFIFLLPFYFPREGEVWDYMWHPIDQLQWSLGPGFPEFRMFRGSPDVFFYKSQHFNVTPQGIKSIHRMPFPINHYLYRSPESQRARARQHVLSGFDPDNYKHITERDEVYWSDEKIGKVLADPAGYFTDLRRDRTGLLA